MILWWCGDWPGVREFHEGDFISEAFDIMMEGVKQIEVIDNPFKEVTNKEEAVVHKPGEDTQIM